VGAALTLQAPAEASVTDTYQHDKQTFCWNFRVNQAC
jgi:hypothetical protein